MKPVKKFGIARLSGDSAVYGVGAALVQAAGFFLLPFLTRHLTLAEYGTVALVGIAVLVLDGAFGLGTANSMGILYGRETDPARRAEILWSNVLLLAVHTTLLALVGAALARPLARGVLGADGLAPVVSLAFGTLALKTVAVPVLNGLRLERRRRVYVAMNVGGAFLTAGLSVYAVVAREAGLTGLFAARLIGQAIATAVALAGATRWWPFRLTFASAGRLARWGAPSAFGVLAFYVLDNASRLVLERAVGRADLGVYAVAVSLAAVTSLAVDAFGAAWAPFFLSFSNNPRAGRAVFGRALRVYLGAFFILSLGVTVAGRWAIELLTTAPYHGAAALLPWLTAAYLCRGAYLILLPGLYFRHWLHRQAMIEWGAAAVAVAAAWALVPAGGQTAAAAATFVGYVGLPLLAYIAARNTLAVAWGWRRVWPLVAGYAAVQGLLRAVYPSGTGVYLFGGGLMIVGYSWFVVTRRDWRGFAAAVRERLRWA